MLPAGYREGSKFYAYEETIPVKNFFARYREMGSYPRCFTISLSKRPVKLRAKEGSKPRSFQVVDSPATQGLAKIPGGSQAVGHHYEHSLNILMFSVQAIRTTKTEQRNNIGVQRDNFYKLCTPYPQILGKTLNK
jgi:hypothetical protein